MAGQRFLENVTAVVDDNHGCDGAVCARRALQQPLAAQLTNITLEPKRMRWCICDKCMFDSAEGRC